VTAGPSDEVDWLLDTCRSVLRGERPASAGEAPADLDWREVASIVATSRTAALLGWAEAERLVRLPDWLAETVAAGHHFNGSRFRLLHDELVAVCATLPSDVRLIARKGVHLAALYPSPATRALSDVDLLLHRDDEAATVEALRQAGFVQGKLSDDGTTVEPVDRATLLFYRMGTGSLPPFYKRSPPRAPMEWIGIDLAIDLGPPRLGSAPPVDEIWTARRMVPDVPLPVASPTFLLVDLCMNLYLNNTTLRYVAAGRHRRLTPYLDLVAVIGEGIVWADATEALRAYPAMVEPVHFALGNLERLFPGTIEPGVLAELRALGAEPALLDVVGRLELAEPYVWTCGLHERMFGDAVPHGLPPANVLL